MVARDNDRDDNGKGGDPPVPNGAAASGDGDDDIVGTVDLHEGVVGQTGLCQVSAPVRTYAPRTI